MRLVIAAFCLLGAASAAADTAVPDPSRCFVTPCPVVCPSAELPLEFVIRGFDGNPIPGSTVTLHFGDCALFLHCPVPTPGPYILDDVARTVRIVTDAEGRAALSLPMSAICLNATLRITADGVPIAQRSLTTPDQDGDLDVDAIDVGLVQGQLGYPDTQDATGDFDCDGTITTSDLSFVQQHSGHICPILTGLKKASWGRIKTIYR